MMTGRGLRAWLIRLPRLAKQAIVVCVDATILFGALVAAVAFVADDTSATIRSGWLHFPLGIGLAIGLLARAGFYQTIIRYVGSHLPLAVFACITLAVLTMAAARAWGGLPGLSLPRPILLAFWAFAVLGITASRLLMRAWLIRTAADREPVIVYGAGHAGAHLLASLAMGARFRVVAVVDDNPALQGRLLSGVRIGAPSQLPALVAKLAVRRILLALPSVTRHRRRQIINRLADLPVHVQTIPDIADLVQGRARFDDIQDVDAMDLLGRDPIPPHQELLTRCIAGKVVMVTGAGGSIGSELCRQILTLGPRRLVLFELSELALYRLEQELREVLRGRDQAIELVALLGSVHHRERVRGIMVAFGVQTVYHAAAYKHVPIVEQNMVEGIHNNIVGTWYAAEAAEEAGVETFVLISTDKAVSPVNVMGATKRFAELVLQGMAQRGSRTRFCMVRFGNVLESSGSVVPLFREQIRRGGPVTVTHPDVIRYFMTIPEAAQLVIQAGAMGQGGDVFLLEMGEPVRIADLARRMIQLTGLTVRDERHPDGEIAIEFTGLRHGEKLFEELLIGGSASATEHPMILRAVEACLPWSRVQHFLTEFLQAAHAFDCERTFQLLKAAVDGYRPVMTEIQDLVWQVGQGRVGGRQSERTRDSATPSRVLPGAVLDYPSPPAASVASMAGRSRLG